MEEADVDGALIVQPINHKFDHSLVTRSDEMIMSLYFFNKDFSLCFLILFSAYSLQI